MASFLTAFAVSLVLTFFFRTDPETPSRFGGLAIAAALLAGSLWNGVEPDGFWVGLLFIFAMGLCDDVWTLSPPVKLIGQIIAALIFLMAPPTGAIVPATSMLIVVAGFWIVAITNSLNLLDNMDGITPGVAAIAALALVLLGIGKGAVYLSLSGALLAFLFFNFHPARVYLGDGGSHLVGFTLASLSVPFLESGRWWIPPVILFLPILDTGFVILTRVARGVSPFQGGKDHLAHRLARFGWSNRGVALLAYTITAIVGALAMVLQS